MSALQWGNALQLVPIWRCFRRLPPAACCLPACLRGWSLRLITVGTVLPICVVFYKDNGSHACDLGLFCYNKKRRCFEWFLIKVWITISFRYELYAGNIQLAWMYVPALFWHEQYFPWFYWEGWVDRQELLIGAVAYGNGANAGQALCHADGENEITVIPCLRNFDSLDGGDAVAAGHARVENISLSTNIRSRNMPPGQEVAGSSKHFSFIKRQTHGSTRYKVRSRSKR